MTSIRRWVLYSVLSAFFLLTFYHLSHSTTTGSDVEQPVPQQVPTTSPPPSIHYKWKEHLPKYPVTSLVSFPTGRPTPIPRVQFQFEAEDAGSKVVRERRLQIVKEAFMHSWDGYKKNAWLKDEVAPVTGGYRSTFGGWGATLVDTLDTLWIMGMKEEFEEAVAAVIEIDFSVVQQNPLNIFETTIRYLGGLLGAYDVSDGNYPALLRKAVEVGEVLYVAFDTPNRMPITRWSADDGRPQAEALEKTLVAEIGSLSLEFTRLSQLSGDMKYFDAIQRITDVFDKQQNLTKLPGMWPILVNARTEDFSRDTLFTLGGMADSVYEYLPKV
jgi:mannosyl-oligosaccharide alpha-1,2-mannosidase